MKKRVYKRRPRVDSTLARMRVLKAAKKQGVISNDLACTVGGFNQAWYHLNAMVKAGTLKRIGYNQWVPAGRR